MYEDLRFYEDGEEEMTYEDELGGLMEDESLWEDPEDPFLFEEEGGLYESWEDMESDGYYEADPFIGKWAKKAAGFVKKAAKGPLGKLARMAATAAGGAIGGPFGAKIASTIANRVIRESDMEGDMEDESDPEGDLEMMGANMEVFEEMKYLSALASETDNEEEIDQFLGGIAKLAGPLIKSLAGETDHEEGFFEGEEGYYESEEGYYESDQFFPLIGLAAKLLPKALPLIRKGIKGLSRVMKSSPQSQKVVGASLPQLIAKTATTLARQAQAGKPITPQTVASTMARQTAKAIARPAAVRRGAQANREAARQHVQAKGPAPRVPVRTARGSRTVAIPVRPAVVRRAVQGGPVPLGSPRIVGRAYGGRRRIVRPRYCVY
jgi:hypothetical protein